MIVGLLKEPDPETRVSLLAEHVSVLAKKGWTIWVESGAGEKAFCDDEDYSRYGAQVKSRKEVIEGTEILLCMQAAGVPAALKSKTLVGAYQPQYYLDLMKQWAMQDLTSFSLDMLPRITRAQPMDVLSSQANIAGYKAVLIAADLFPRYFPMLMTAAGSIAPARLLILGAGVAGLQAVATARRLGAVVEVFDTRPAVREEVMSLGAKFIDVEGAADASAAGGYAVEQSEEFQVRQKNRIGASIAKADIVITTAQIPGKQAPILVTSTMIEAMKKGSVIIDLAASSGGNTELTKDRQTVVHHGVRIVGQSSLPSTMPLDASRLYGRNLIHFLDLLADKEGRLAPDFADELVKGACITRGGEVVHERIK
jgi:NAD(P) transhydrogenase subunit alpha